MEIERKFKILNLPALSEYKYHDIEQAYINDNPVIRVRKEDDTYYMTYKGGGMLAREEYNLPLTKESYEHLREKVDGILIKKRRYKIPYQEKYTIELDVFEEELAPLLLAEVEFDTREEADVFVPPLWFGEDVTFSGKYQNSYLSRFPSK